MIVSAEELSHLPGAPFSPDEVEAAVAAVEAAVGWHVAPVQSDTVLLDVESWNGSRLLLPTARLLSVEAVRDADTGEVVDPSSYRVSVRRAAIERVRHDDYFTPWPEGYGAVEVDFTHGFDATPADLLVVIAEAANTARRDQSVRSVQVDDFSTTYGAGSRSSLGSRATLGRYRPHARLGFA